MLLCGWGLEPGHRHQWNKIMGKHPLTRWVLTGTRRSHEWDQGMMLKKEAVYWSAFVTPFMCDPINSQLAGVLLCELTGDYYWKQMTVGWHGEWILPPGSANLFPRAEPSLWYLGIVPKLHSSSIHELVVFATLSLRQLYFQTNLTHSLLYQGT